MGVPRGSPGVQQLCKRHTTQNERRQNGAHFRSPFHVDEIRHDGRQRLLRPVGDGADSYERQAAFGRRQGNVVAFHVDGEGGAASERVGLVLWRREHAIEPQYRSGPHASPTVIPALSREPRRRPRLPLRWIPAQGRGDIWGIVVPRPGRPGV